MPVSTTTWTAPTSSVATWAAVAAPSTTTWSGSALSTATWTAVAVPTALTYTAALRGSEWDGGSATTTIVSTLIDNTDYDGGSASAFVAPPWDMDGGSAPDPSWFIP